MITVQKIAMKTISQWMTAALAAVISLPAFAQSDPGPATGGGINRSYDDGYVFTSPVGTYKPNEIGLYDMTGNVCEWCQDWYDKNYYTYSRNVNPEGPSYGQYRVVRGSSWFASPRGVGTSRRLCLAPMLSVYNLGFRLVLPVKYYRE